jgi:hypothetical protein
VTANSGSGQLGQVRDRAKMVAWFDLRQLVRTGCQVLVSTLIGKNIDRRLIEALAVPGADPIDATKEEDGKPISEIWLDFIADTGDGWNSTYSVAYAASLPILTLEDSKGASHSMRRGRILVFGGDEVYPTPSRALYKQKLVAPFEAALSWTTAPYDRAFAIPGNHDWYDSLVAFTRLFCGREWLGGRELPQTRSYFALKLPHRWWLIGTDVQLGSDVDAPQVDFFKSVAKDIEPGDRVILCTAEPHWIYSHIYNNYNPTVYNESNLQFLEKKILGKGRESDGLVRVFLSGDLHHYRRHATADGRQKITAGGGGAFLHSTFGPDVEQLEGGYRLEKAFPSEQESKKLNWRNLLFAWINPTFGLVTALMYLLTSWTTLSDIGAFGVSQIGRAITTALSEVLRKPSATFWVVGVVAAFVFFTDTHSPSYRVFGGLLHGISHLAALFFLGWSAAYYCVTVKHLAFASSEYLSISGVALFAGGWLVGSLIMGLYLLFSLRLFRRHSNEAFSALRIQDWKNFLRLHIDASGNLTIYPVGIRRVARKWRQNPTAGGHLQLLPDDPRWTGPELLEDPILLRG